MALLFLHIPKTAGTSLDTGWLKPSFLREKRFCETDLFEGDQLVGRHLFAEMEHISKHFNFRYHDVFRFYAQQGLLPLDREYYSGHICFGIHQALEQPCRYITLLRHPVARIVSYYNLVHSLGHFPGTLADFLTSKRYEADNYQVRCL